MAKTQTTILIDVDTYVELKKRKINVSGLINDFLTKYINVENKPKIEGDSLSEKLESARLQQLYINNEVEKLKKEREKQQVLKYGKVRKEIPLN